jgi:photosystem II stability/assembly factor-like uncharacterized protein
MKKFYILLVALFVVNGALAQWTVLSSDTIDHLHSVCFTDANTGYAVGVSGTIIKTTNGGNPVGTNDLSSESSTLNIYPNPTPNQVTIVTPTKDHFYLLNLKGQELFKNEITGTKTQLDISNLSSGIYLLPVTGERIVRVGKFINN